MLWKAAIDSFFFPSVSFFFPSVLNPGPCVHAREAVCHWVLSLGFCTGYFFFFLIFVSLWLVDCVGYVFGRCIPACEYRRVHRHWSCVTVRRQRGGPGRLALIFHFALAKPAGPGGFLGCVCICLHFTTEELWLQSCYCIWLLPGFWGSELIYSQFHDKWFTHQAILPHSRTFCFWDRISSHCPGWTWTHSITKQASQVARIPGLYHLAWF